MPYRPPLVPFETFVADPPDLPVRGPGEPGPSVLTRAEVLGTDAGGATFKGTTSDGSSLIVQVGTAGEGVLRVRLSAEPDACSRSAEAIALVRPGTYPAVVEVTDGTVASFGDKPAVSVASLGDKPAVSVASLGDKPTVSVRIGAGPIAAEITLDPWHLRFVDASGKVLLEQDRGERDISGRVRTLPFGRSLAGGEVAAYHESFLAPAQERFVGLGEKFTRLEKRGQRALMWTFDAFGSESDRSHKPIPLYLSNRGYGVLVDSGMPVEFDMGQSTHSCVQILVPDDLIDYYVLAGPTPADVLKRYNGLTTAPMLPPKWAFGTWISSGFFVDTQEHVMARAENIRRRGIPCDVLHLDCYWQVDGHWSDLQWDTRTFPDPEAMLASLKEQGFRVCLWINPYVSHRSPAFQPAADNGYFLKKTDGSTYVADVWHGSYPACGIIDLTNPAAAEWFANDLRALLRQGVAVFKTDFAEGVPADSVAHNGMRGVDLHNVYTLLFNDIVSTVTREIAGHGTVWARSSFLGGQRHSAQWSGDVNATYPGMASTLRGGLSHGVSGVPFWSHDAGGFNGTPTPDLYVRWSQFGALSPLLRLHGTTSRLPWDFPEDAERHAIEALRLRYTLMPYLYSAAVVSARTGVPMLRALLVDSPDDPAAWTADLEYRLGEDLLVAPMVDPSGERDVYLPEGTWLDYWTGEPTTGGRYIRTAQPVDRIPLFVKDNALITVTAPTDAIGAEPFADLTVVSWGGGDGRTVLHDVDGDSSVVALRTGDTLAVDVTGPARVRRVSVAPVPGRLTPTRITLNGVTL